MKKYRVTGTLPVWVAVEVEVEEGEDADETKENAIEAAMEKMKLESFIGNGGHDKLVGVRDSNISITPGDVVLDGEITFEIDVDEVPADE